MASTMNIPDGEYDIDLSVLDQPDLASSLALRYGFIPDSMDQSQPLALFHSDQVCLLEAQSVERANGSGRGPPIIFEGVPQRQRPAQSSQPLPTDSYFLAFSPRQGADMSVALKRLGNTIRVSKSRNADRWRASIGEWRQNPALLDNSGDKEEKGSELERQRQAQEKAEKEKAEKERIQREKILKEKALRERSQREKAGQDSRADPLKAASKPRPEPLPRSEPKLPKASKTPSKALKAPPRASINQRPARAAKRPPKVDNDIISVSDFEDLSDDDTFPVFETQTEQRQEKQSKAKPAPAKKEEDDFADLEDQLHEVLDEPQSSSDSEPDVFSGGPIVIDGEDTKSRRKYIDTMPNKKPMSLRELHGGEKNDYLSSSEEE